MATHLPVIDQSPKSSLRDDGARNFVYPADVKGRFTSARKVLFVVLIGIYAALPWIKIRGNPAVYLDIPGRRFFLFGMTFNAQDIWMTVFLLTGAAFGLVFTTALLGRAWCGYACPQTVFLDGVYRRIERLVEGPREKRMRRANGRWTFDRLWRRVVVHATWVIVSLLLAHVFLSYFVSIPQLFQMMRHEPGEHPEAFGVVMSLAAILYFNFSWFREQFCVIMCPYGRLQSMLLDSDSLVIGYDTRRGEPRGKVKEQGRGECVDCGRCVAVCPTGIDIRNGLQMDCVACAQCIDACDEIMDRVGQERGLIRYDSQNGLAGNPRRLLRPRMYVYAALGALGLVVATLSLASRSTFECNVLRVQGAPYVIDDGKVRNMYRVHLFNKEGHATTFHIEPEQIAGITYTLPLRDVKLGSLESMEAPLVAEMPLRELPRELPLHVTVRDDDGVSRVVIAPFLGPSHVERRDDEERSEHAHARSRL